MPEITKLGLRGGESGALYVPIMKAGRLFRTIKVGDQQPSDADASVLHSPRCCPGPAGCVRTRQHPAKVGYNANHMSSAC